MSKLMPIESGLDLATMGGEQGENKEVKDKELPV